MGKLRQKLKSILISGAVIFSMNQLVLPVQNIMGNFLQGLHPGNYSLKKYHLPKNLKAPQYLVMANSIVHENATKKFDCKDYSIRTYKMYHKIIKRIGRNDLYNKIRIVNNQTHLWIQYRAQNKKIHNFEATINLGPFKNLEELIVASRVRYISLSEKKILGCTAWGSQIFYPTIDAIIYRGGFIGYLMDIYSKK
ncbi:MAG: hypothetical protein U9Q69_05030 [Nanoarchaeota archaeon]|nr:hypothetical protein [Nanoarchaeota archaeon]